MKKLFIIFGLLLAFPAFAANEGVEAEPLNFGQLIITDNSAMRSCTVTAGGSFSCDPEIIILQPGQEGIFRLSGYDSNVAIWAYIDDSGTTLSSSGGQIFDIKNFTFDPAIDDIGTAQAPAGGEMLLHIGATLQTRAGVSYSNAVYRGTFTLQINY